MHTIYNENPPGCAEHSEELIHDGIAFDRFSNYWLRGYMMPGDLMGDVMNYLVKIDTLTAQLYRVSPKVSSDLHILILNQVCQAHLLRLRIEFTRFTPNQSIPGQVLAIDRGADPCAGVGKLT